MRVLVTGAAGFIGSNLTKACLDAGWDVTGVDDLSNGHREFLPEGFGSRRGEFYEKSFDDDKILNLVIDKAFDVIIHLAAVPRVSYSVEHPTYTNDVNVSKTLRLMDCCRRLEGEKEGNIKRFVFASSSSVYGGADPAFLPTHENHPKNPKSPYALQKSIIEGYLDLWAQLYGMDSVCLRFFNVFGPNQLGDSPYATAVSAWLTAIKKGMPMRSDGDGTQSRDMCYVDNVVDACMKAASISGGSTFDGRCYNVACGDRTTNNEILTELMKRYPGATVVNAPQRPGDVMHTQADVSRAAEELDYVPKVRFWEGLNKTINWYEDNWDRIKGLKLKT